MARSSSAAALPPVRTFDQLVRAVEVTLIASHARIEWEGVLANWNTGRLINEHVLLHERRADYAGQVYSALARRTNIHQRLLYQCAQFARLFPILHRGAKLGWSHYRLLCQVPDAGDRSSLELEAVRRAWTAPQLEDRVRQLNLLRGQEDETAANPDGSASTRSRPRPLTAKCGQPGLYPVVARPGGALALDLGFKVFLPLEPALGNRVRGWQSGDIVRVQPDGSVARAEDAVRADLFTYRTADARVIDGDTIALTVRLPPYNDLDKKLRLRGLNCPEMDTEAGRAAKQFTQKRVAGAQSVLITTTKPDKYDRYLADVFLFSDSAGTAADSIFLNNALLENGHAVRSDGSIPADWIV